MGGVMYQTGFKQRLYFKSYEDYPIFDINTEKVTNGDGRAINSFSRQVNKRKLVFLGIFASQMSAFKRIEQHNNIQIVENGVTTIIRNPTVNLEFDTEIEPLNCLSKASIIFETSTSVKTYCNRNEFVI
jgi:hypothetical protein